MTMPDHSVPDWYANVFGVSLGGKGEHKVGKENVQYDMVGSWHSNATF
jgi:hypothetical protein